MKGDLFLMHSILKQAQYIPVSSKGESPVEGTSSLEEVMKRKSEAT